MKLQPGPCCMWCLLADFPQREAFHLVCQEQSVLSSLAQSGQAQILLMYTLFCRQEMLLCAWFSWSQLALSLSFSPTYLVLMGWLFGGYSRRDPRSATAGESTHVVPWLWSSRTGGHHFEIGCPTSLVQTWYPSLSSEVECFHLKKAVWSAFARLGRTGQKAVFFLVGDSYT